MAVSFEQFQKLRSQGLSNEQIRKFDSGFVPQNVPQETQKSPGMVSRFLTGAKEVLPKLGGEIIQRGKKAFSSFSRGTQYDAGKGIIGNAVEGGLTPLRIAGQAAGAVGDVLGAGAELAYKTAVPEPTKEKIKSHVLDILDTPSGRAGLQVLKQGGDVYQRFKEANPETAQSLEDILNIATVIPGVKVAKKGAAEVKNIASDTLEVAARLKGGSEGAVNKIIDKGIEKGIRPSVVGKKTAQQVNAFKQDARTAVLAITKNKKALSFANDVGESVKGIVPRSLKEFAESVDQTKKTIFKKYDSLAKKAGEAGARVNLAPVAEELKKVGADKVLNDLYPEVVSYAEKRAETLAKRTAYSAEEAQTAIKHLNESLQAFYRNPTFESASKAQIDAMIANNIRSSLDNVITSATGEGYSALKKVYGSLKAIEKDVAHRAIVDARKNVKGLIDFTDIFSAGDIISGVATMNPAQIAKGGVQKAIATLYKKINDPNRTIKNMFQGAEKYLQRKESSFAPKSMTGKGVVALKGKGGMSIQDVSGGKAGYPTKRGFGTGAGRTAGVNKASLKSEVSNTLDSYSKNLEPNVERGFQDFDESTALNELNSLKKHLSKANTVESIKSIQQEAKTIVDKVLKGRSDKLAPVIKNETKMNLAIEKAKKFKFFEDFSKAYPNTPKETLKKIFLESRK